MEVPVFPTHLLSNVAETENCANYKVLTRLKIILTKYYQVFGKIELYFFIENIKKNALIFLLFRMYSFFIFQRQICLNWN